MKILFITPYIPSRIRVRPFQIIRELSERHTVRVVALCDAHKSRVPGLEEIMRSVSEMDIVPHPKLRGLMQSLAALPTRSPMCTAYCRSGRMMRTIDRIAEEGNFDVVHVEHLRAAHFAPSIRRAPAILDSVDCLTHLFSQVARSEGRLAGRIVAAEEAWKLGHHEPRMLRTFDRVVVTSDRDRDNLIGLDAGLEIDVVPNGVDTDYFAPKCEQRNPARLVFSGKMSYAPNIEAVLWFAEAVLPDLRARFPALEFVIVGSEPPPEVLKLSGIPGVSVTGYVEDIRSHVDTCAISLAPIKTGVGMQNKVLEAMAMAMPVVATSTAARCFGAGCDGIVSADSAEEFLEQISRLIRNPAEAADTGARGRQRVISEYSWQSSVSTLEAVYENALRSFRQGR